MRNRYGLKINWYIYKNINDNNWNTYNYICEIFNYNYLFNNSNFKLLAFEKVSFIKTKFTVGIGCVIIRFTCFQFYFVLNNAVFSHHND